MKGNAAANLAGVGLLPNIVVARYLELVAVEKSAMEYVLFKVNAAAHMAGAM